MLRTLARRRFLTHISTGAVVTPWWLSGGISATNCIAAYQPKGAASYAASKINLANPGTYDATDGTAYPTWAALTGWSFNGLTQYLLTGITPANGWSAIVRVANVANGGAAFGEGGIGNSWFGIRPARNGTTIQYMQGAVANNASGQLVSGTVAIANQIGYKNGASDITGIGAWTGSAPRTIAVGTAQTTDFTTYIYQGDVLALAIYNTALSGTVIGLLHTAIMAL